MINHNQDYKQNYNQNNHNNRLLRGRFLNAKMGVAGAAAATCASEIAAFALYGRQLVKKNLISWKKVRIPESSVTVFETEFT